MPSLIDLYKQNQPRGFDPSNVANIVASNPTGLVTGALQLIPTTLQGIGKSLLNIGQSVSPIQLPGADPIQNSIGGRVEQLLSGVTMGVYDQAKQHYQDSGSLTSAAGQTLYDLLPIDEALSLSSGKDAQGNNLTSEQLSQQFIQGLLETLPVAKGLKTVKGALNKNVPKGQVGRALRTNQEIASYLDAFAKGEAKKDANVLLQSAIERPRSASGTPVVEGIDGATRKPDGRPNLISDPQLQNDFDSVLGNEALMKAMVPRIEKHLLDQNKTPYFARAWAEEVKNMFDEGVDPSVVVQTAKSMGMDLPSVAEALVERADQWVTVGESSSRVMNMIRQFSQSHKAFMRDIIDYSKKFENDPEVIKRLEAAATKLGPTTIYQNAAKAWKGYTDIARKAAVSQWATTARNTTVQGINGVVNLMEDALADSFDFARDSYKAIKKGDSSVIKRPSDYYADTMGDFFGAWGSTLSAIKTVGEKNPISKLLKIKIDDSGWGKAYHDYNRMVTMLEENLPAKEVGKVMGDQVMGDIVSKSALLKHAKNLGMKGRIDKLTDALLIPNKFAERHFRTAFYTGRLYGNLQRLGINSLDEFERMLKSGDKLPDNIQHAVTDAIDHSLKQTFAMDPAKGTLGHTVLGMYREFPFLAGLGPMFPRFLINQYRYLVERNPFQWGKMLSPEFRQQWMDATNGVLAQKEASRVLARATTGGAMMSAALTMHQMGQREGLKYYQLDTGETDAKGNRVIADLRPYQPLTSYLFLSELTHGAARGESMPKNLTSSELIDAIAGIRNLSEVPIFAMADIIRSADSNDPMALPERLQKFGGQMLAMPFVPLRTLNDLMAAAGDEDAANLKDTKGDLLLGPPVANIPVARNMLNDLPDPLTGQPMQSENPGLRQFTGATLATLDPLESALQSVGMRIGDLTGSWKNPEAGRLVRKYLGEMLGSKISSDETLSQVLGKRINTLQIDGQPIPDSLKRYMLQQLFTRLRESAKAKAMSENPRAFLEDILKSQPEPVRDYISMTQKANQP